MGKIHLLMRKEDIDHELMKGKIAIVFDVLLATSTITSALENGAREVIPVLNKDEALAEASKREEGSYLLAGEYAGFLLNGFVSPLPLELEGQVSGKTMILSTTNGTVAIKKAASAKKVYAASLLNGSAVADVIRRFYADETVVLVCSSSMEKFCLEDFYGAGYFLDCLVNPSASDWEMTDSAKTALFFYRGNIEDSAQILKQARVGEQLTASGREADVRYVARRGVFSAVPCLSGQTLSDEQIADEINTHTE